MPGAILVLGAAGVFGSRLSRLLARERDRTVILAGRDTVRLAALKCDIRRACPASGVITRQIGLPDGLTPALLKDVAVVVHAAGPFQGRDYRVARACIAQGVHYVDLADGRDFVSGFDALDAEARAAGVLAVSGASSVPGISGAAVAHLRPDFDRVDRLAIGIAPGNRAPRGRAVVEAILSYVGKPIPGGYGWQDLRRRSIGCDGVEPLGARWFAACDVPDLTLLQRRDPSLGQVTFHAGLELAVMHLGLWLLSWPVRAGVLRSLLPLAAPLTAIARLLEPFGTDRGGMFVELSGTDRTGRPLSKAWTLIAERGDGPWVPTLAALIVVRKLLDGSLGVRGARACLDLFDIAEVEAELARFEIVAGTA
jgi:hypothetical protein